jgi:hypothetical protein
LSGSIQASQCAVLDDGTLPRSNFLLWGELQHLQKESAIEYCVRSRTLPSCKAKTTDDTKNKTSKASKQATDPRNQHQSSTNNTTTGILECFK